MPSPAPPPVAVAIYDRDGSATIKGLGPRERIAACYRWASARGVRVIEHATGFGAAADPALATMLELCREQSADLLVYSSDCLAADEARFEEIAATYAPLVIFTASGVVLEAA